MSLIIYTLICHSSHIYPHMSHYRDLPELVDRLSDVITDRRKSVLFHYVCQMLPEDSQLQFDNLAATKLAKCENL